MTNTTTFSPTASPIVESQFNEDSHSYEVIFYSVMGGVLTICALVSINEVYGPFFGVERSHPVLPEGVEPSSSWSFMDIIHNIWDVVDAYRAATSNEALSADGLHLVGVSQPTIDNPV